jgi:hypothetical protein
MDEALYAPLTAALIRRARPSFGDWYHEAQPGSSLADDFRFFATSWAAGFAFFLLYLG